MFFSRIFNISSTNDTCNTSNSTARSENNYSTIADDIDICEKEIKGQLKSISGDISIEESSINGNVSSLSGDINTQNSKITGSIETTSGDIQINRHSNIKGNIKTTSGDIQMFDSNITGNVNSLSGKIKLYDSNIDGILEVDNSNLTLKGENTIKHIVLKNSDEFSETITVKNKNCTTNINGGIFHGPVIFDGNQVNYVKNNTKPKTPEFVIPKGTKILEIIEFKSSKPGIVYMDKNNVFLGKIINGVIKRI